MTLAAFRSQVLVKVIVDGSLNCGFAGSLMIRVLPTATVTQITVSHSEKREGERNHNLEQFTEGERKRKRV